MGKKLLKKVVAEDAHEKLAVADAKLGNVIKEKLEMSCVHDSKVGELMRCIRSQASGLISGLPDKEMAAMELGLAHSLSRYKLKFSPDKIDTMIVQAVSLLDDLDKELNNYIMRCREWYGWHFPEMGKVVTDNLAYVRTVQKMGMRVNAASTDLSEILPEEVEVAVKEAAEISMGTEISEVDLLNIKHLCEQVVEIQEYRDQLYTYLKNRMVAIAPNLTVLVGELVGARLISHAGSLMNLAKHPASTVQILGAEKALFKALKTKHDTPKYGLIYHAQVVGQASAPLKGKASRMLAAKAALACRADALFESLEANNKEKDVKFDPEWIDKRERINKGELGLEGRTQVETRIRILEGGHSLQVSGTGKAVAKFEKHEMKSEVQEYKPAADNTLKRKIKEETETANEPVKKIKVEDEAAEETPKKKKKKNKENEKEENGENLTPEVTTPVKPELNGANGHEEASPILNGATETESAKKKKKKKKNKEAAVAE